MNPSKFTPLDVQVVTQILCEYDHIMGLFQHEGYIFVLFPLMFLKNFSCSQIRCGARMRILQDRKIISCCVLHALDWMHGN